MQFQTMRMKPLQLPGMHANVLHVVLPSAANLMRKLVLDISHGVGQGVPGLNDILLTFSMPGMCVYCPGFSA